jgi:regulator of PEP synthase PpsR (kinase-PPPase family)
LSNKGKKSSKVTINILKLTLQLISAIKSLYVNSLYYTDIKIVQEECREVRRICSKNNWQVIDVSRRSIEETAAIIMKYYYEHKKRDV